MDFGPICEPSLRDQIQTYEEHSTYRAHYRRRRPRRCARTNTTSNFPSTETSLIAAGFKAKEPQNPKQQKLYDALSADRCRGSYARLGAPSTKDGGHLIVNRIANFRTDLLLILSVDYVQMAVVGEGQNYAQPIVRAGLAVSTNPFLVKDQQHLKPTRMRFAKMPCPKMLVRGFHLIRKASHRWTQIFTDVRRSEFLNLCFIRVNPWRKSFLLS